MINGVLIKITQRRISEQKTFTCTTTTTDTTDK